MQATAACTELGSAQPQLVFTFVVSFVKLLVFWYVVLCFVEFLVLLCLIEVFCILSSVDDFVLWFVVFCVLYMFFAVFSVLLCFS